MDDSPDTHPARRAWLDAAVVAAAVTLGLVVASAVVRTSVVVGPLTLKARIAYGWPGIARVEVPPFGSATAATHVGPSRLIVTVQSVSVPGVERLLTPKAPSEATSVPQLRSLADSAQATVSDVLERRRRTAGQDIAGLIALSALVAAATATLAALAARRRRRVVGIAAATAFVVVVGSSLIAVATFDARALSEPRLEGALASVPRLGTIFSARLGSIERLRDQAAEVSADVAAYYANPRSIAAGGGLPDTYRILHVSDLHLDPVGAELARSLARSYEASLVIDTGDISISGTREESVLLSSLAVTDTPVLYVPGNHDSTTTAVVLQSLPNVSVLSSGTVTIDGLRIFGMPDPQSAALAIEPDRGLLDARTDAARTRLESDRDRGVPPPDIIVLHDPRFERRLVGLAPLILSGHTHSPRLYRSGDTVRLNSGTLGGMPYDPVLSRRATLPHSASVLYYTDTVPRRLVAIDTISVSADRTTTLSRHVIDEALIP